MGSPAETDAPGMDLPIDTGRRFGGVARLYGAAALARFGRAHVCVAGVGGVGSWAVEALARSGLGRLTLIDPDVVAPSNVNRQLHALSAEFGRAKVAVLAERVAGINPHCRVEAIDDLVELHNLDALLGRGYDFVIDAVDSVRIKAGMIAYCRRQRVGLVTVGGAGGKSDPTRIRTADLSRACQDPLLARVRRVLRVEYGFPRGPARRFGVLCVYSDELPVYPGIDGEPGRVRPVGAGGLNCAGGLGSVMTATAGFGLAAVSAVLARLTRG